MKNFIATLCFLIPGIATSEIIVLPELRLSAEDRKALISQASMDHAASYNLSEIRAFEDSPPFADVIWGPQNSEDHYFVVAISRCVLEPSQDWSCEPSRNIRFVYVDSPKDSFQMGSNISDDAALAILRAATQKCDIEFSESFVFKPDLDYDKEDDIYRLYGSNCTYEFAYSDGVAKVGSEFHYLE